MRIKVMNTIEKVINKLIHLEEIDGGEFMSLSKSEQEKIGFYARDFGMEHWDWPQGVGLFGLANISNKYVDYIINWADEKISKGLPVSNVNTVCPMLTIMDYPQYEELSLIWANEVYANFDRTDENGIQHNTTGATKKDLVKNEEQIWADTIFMTILFLGKMGVKYQRKEWIEEAIYQVLVHIKYLLDRETSLFYHGWDFSQRSNFGANFWCRGNSWLVMGIPLFCQIMEGHLAVEVKDYLLIVYQNQVTSLFKLKDSETNLWHTILDDKESYIETSGSAGILAGVYLGLRNGYLKNENFGLLAEKSIASLISHVDDDGTLQGVSAGTAISSTKEDYKNIIVKPMAYGQAMCLFALGQYHKYIIETFGAK